LTGRRRKLAELPSRDECLRILRENSCDDQVIGHCEAVSALGVKIAKRCHADMALVETGGLLHDIGRCRTHGIRHAVEGAELAAELGLPDAVVKIIEHHIGAGIKPSEAVKLGLPRKDYTPKTLEEKIVAHSDNLMSGSRRTDIKEAVGNLTRKGQHTAALRVLKLHEELSEICGMNLDDIF
jgi:uncharacterized protein (TIGR00295 family)